jgi:hypothetical protein
MRSSVKKIDDFGAHGMTINLLLWLFLRFFIGFFCCRVGDWICAFHGL